MNNVDLSKEILLVIAPHPDDEVLGCGGLISKVKKAGGKVFVIIVCVGNQTQYGSISKTSARKSELKQTMAFLDVDDYDLLFDDDETHLRLDMLPLKKLIDLIESGSKVSINKVKPTILALPFGQSCFQDHEAVFRATFAACRPKPKNIKHMVDTVLVYSIPSDMWSINNFEPNFFVDISNEIKSKLDALLHYKSQIHPDPHPCSIENVKRIAEVNGSLVGIKSAESFMCLRNLLK